VRRHDLDGDHHGRRESAHLHGGAPAREHGDQHDQADRRDLQDAP
jgi:hypothetical protein